MTVTGNDRNRKLPQPDVITTGIDRNRKRWEPEVIGSELNRKTESDRNRK